MDNICNKASKRISGLLKTADIEVSASDTQLIAELEHLAEKVDGLESLVCAIQSINEITTASAALQCAKTLVTQDRRATHGTMIYGFEKIARLWSAMLAGRDLAADPLEGSEVCDMMELLKIARRGSGQFNPDDYVDGAGYAACALECRHQEAWCGSATPGKKNEAWCGHE